jgi:hypothetical protein
VPEGGGAQEREREREIEREREREREREGADQGALCQLTMHASNVRM